MLNLINKNKILANNKKLQIIPETITNKTPKHFPNSTREWKNSIYLFNKNNLNLIPSTANTCFKVTKSYFTLFNEILENKLRKIAYMLRFRKWSQNKIFVNNGEFKHTNNKVVLTFYLFNRQINNFGLAMRILKKFLFKGLNNNPEIISKRLNEIEKESFSFSKDENCTPQMKKIISISEKMNQNIISKKGTKYINICLRNFFLKLLKREYDRRLKCFYYKQMMFINKQKSTYLFLQYLKQHVYRLYNKQVEFNLINLERFYLNSDIFLESVVKKISRKRRKVLTYIKKASDKVLVLKKNSFFHIYKTERPDEKIVLSKNDQSLADTIINKLKYRDVTGLKLQAKGRLTKRYTASRSVTKVVHKGNLFNRDASLKGLSSVILKGNLKSNLQYTESASKSRIGSFGLKGWINSDQ